MRTHALLAVGCSFLMSISIWAIRITDPNLDYDISVLRRQQYLALASLALGSSSKINSLSEVYLLQQDYGSARR